MHHPPAPQDPPADPAIRHVPWLQPIKSVLSRLLDRIVEASITYAQAMHPELLFRTEADKPDDARAEDPPRRVPARDRGVKARL